MKSYLRLRILLILFYILDSGLCYKCNFIDNISIRVVPKSRIPYFKNQVQNNFSGCFEQNQFDQVVTEIGVVDQNIIELGDHAVQNLLELTAISFTGCGIKKINTRAFENLPKLQVINIVDNKLKSVSAGIFNDLESLEDINLCRNQISEMKRSAIFGYMPSLEHINLSENKLRDIDFFWFFESPNIILLDFSHNNIQQIEKYTFKYLPNLKDLFLDYNEIRYIEETSFQNLTSMEILSLRHNKITQLSPNVIGEKFQVQLFQLNANMLNYLPKKLLNKLTVNTLELAGNPWNCLCLNEIHQWMLQTNVTLKNNRYCSTRVPQCFYSPNISHCSETLDTRQTESFLKSLRDINPAIEEECANLS